MEQRDIWQAFFKDVPHSQYSVLIHRVDGRYESWIPGAQHIATRPSAWGDYSLVEIELDLYERGMVDNDCDFFILLSGDSVPLYPFQHVKQAITGDRMHIVEPQQKDINKRELNIVNKHLLPNQEAYRWRMASQWKILSRATVSRVLEYRTTLHAVFGKIFCADEHAIANLLPLLNIHPISTSSTYVAWSKSGLCRLDHRPRPKTFHLYDLRPEMLKTIRESGSLFLRKLCKLTQVPPLLLETDTLPNISNVPHIPAHIKNPAIIARLMRKFCGQG